MKGIKRSVRVLGQALQVRTWEVEARRARFQEAALAFARCEEQQRGIEAEIRALGEHARLRLAPGRALDVAALHHARLHGEEWQRHLHAAADETARAGHQQDEAREALAAVFSEHEVLDNRRQELLLELRELGLKQRHREQDESYAARSVHRRPAHEQD